MTTLIECYSAQHGRCDAKCYDATGPRCHCVCGGMNHGKGLELATEQTRELAADQVRAIEARGGWIADEVRQAVLL